MFFDFSKDTCCHKDMGMWENSLGVYNVIVDIHSFSDQLNILRDSKKIDIESDGDNNDFVCCFYFKEDWNDCQTFDDESQGHIKIHVHNPDSNSELLYHFELDATSSQMIK